MTRLTDLRLRGLGLECDHPPEEAIEALRSPAPGVPGIEATVHAARVDGDDLLPDVELDPRDFVAQTHALDLDDLETLADLKAAGLPVAEVKALVDRLHDTPNLVRTRLNSTGGDLTPDRYPSKPDL